MMCVPTWPGGDGVDDLFGHPCHADGDESDQDLGTDQRHHWSAGALPHHPHGSGHAGELVEQFQDRYVLFSYAHRPACAENIVVVMFMNSFGGAPP
jgi:hypothetical protein